MEAPAPGRWHPLALSSSRPWREIFAGLPAPCVGAYLGPGRRASPATVDQARWRGAFVSSSGGGLLYPLLCGSRRPKCHDSIRPAPECCHQLRLLRPQSLPSHGLPSCSLRPGGSSEGVTSIQESCRRSNSPVRPNPRRPGDAAGAEGCPSILNSPDRQWSPGRSPVTSTTLDSPTHALTRYNPWATWAVGRPTQNTIPCPVG
jgi:hypothetical protein